MKPMLKTRTNPDTGKPEAWNEALKEWQSPEQFYGGSAVKKSRLVESYQTMGLSEAEAQVAAGVDRAFRSKDVNRAFQAGRVFESALLMGFNEAEAAVFADPKLSREDALKSEK